MILSTLNKILILLIILVIIYTYNKNILLTEGFTNDNNHKGIIINMNDVGFFSQINFTLNKFIYCKKYNINFNIESDKWIYKYNYGWLDYFENIDLMYPESNNMISKQIDSCCSILEQFPLSDYIREIPNFYKLNDDTKKYIKKMIIKLGLNSQDYGAIYIRRGDKLVDEAEFINSEKFIEYLLKLYPDCRKVFVQTDDYNCVKDIKKYINKRNLNINVLTLCPNNVFGSIANNKYLDKIKSNDINYIIHTNKRISDDNKKYLSKININLSKPISEMTPSEIKSHTLELLTSVDICTKSKYCVCEYSSNISRFIKLAHNNFANVFDVNGEDSTISLDTKACPGNPFNSIFNK